jgi:hypothetical protein
MSEWSDCMEVKVIFEIGTPTANEKSRQLRIFRDMLDVDTFFRFAAGAQDAGYSLRVVSVESAPLTSYKSWSTE